MAAACAAFGRIWLATRVLRTRDARPPAPMGSSTSISLHGRFTPYLTNRLHKLHTYRSARWLKRQRDTWQCGIYAKPYCLTLPVGFIVLDHFVKLDYFVKLD